MTRRTVSVLGLLSALTLYFAAGLAQAGDGIAITTKSAEAKMDFKAGVAAMDSGDRKSVV